MNNKIKTKEETILIDFNQTETAYPKNNSMIELFENIVDKNQNNIAVRNNNKKITYYELNKRANQLAEKLRNQGVKSNQFVAITVEKSIETIIGILGIIKAGGAYLPIDPKFPLERILFMIEDSKCEIILTAESKLIEILETKVKVIDYHSKNIFVGSGQNLKNVNMERDLVYLIYTSGTTGKPKGVMVEHRSINRLVRNTNYINFTNIRILQTGSLTFDASTFEIWGALLNGGMVYIAKTEELTSTESLKNVLKKNNINSMFITTALFNQFVSMDYTVFDSLKQLLFGGEATSEEHVEILRRYNHKILLSNVYGPTEATTFALHYPIGGDADTLCAKTPIGKPISNTQAYILNGLELCDIGVAGELCIGGPGIARGYLNREELTKEKFIKNPYKAGEIIYRTGDIAKWHKDGNIEFLGRIDDQVKLRGFRIELAEIESRLREMKEVSDAKVVLDDINGDKFLGAYIISKNSIEISEIKEQLIKVLPDYMIPAQIMKIEKFPINKNGKVDKNALPKFEIISDKEYEPPKNDKEAIILEVYKEILGAKHIGIRDSFFELGGDSIKAIRLVSKLRGHGYEISISEVMKQKTIEALAVKAELIDNPAVDQSEVLGKVLLTPIQKQFFNSDLPEPHHLNQSVMFESDEKIEENYLQKALSAITRHHDMLRAVYTDGDQIIQSISDKEWFELEHFDYSDMDNQQEAICLLEEQGDALQANLNLWKGPLIRVGLFRTKKKDYILICVHHLIIDGISWRIFAEDLNNGYLLAKQGKEIVLPEKTASYQVWSRLLTEYRENHLLKREIPYWQRTENIIQESKLKLIADKNDRGILEKKVALSEMYTNKLLNEAMKISNIEINDLLLTAVFRAIQKLTGKENLSVYMEGHGREPIHKMIPVDRTIGWFTTIFPLAVQDIGKSVIEDILSTKEALRRIPNHGLGYTVMNELGKKVLKNVKPDITFNYLGNFNQENNSQIIKIKDTDHGKQVSPQNRFGTPIVFDGVVIHKEFQMSVAYDTSVCDSNFICDLIHEFKRQLISIIEFCIENVKETKCFSTPSDKGELEWSIEEYTNIEHRMLKEDLEIERIYPMTSMQEGMLYHKIADHNSTCYIVQSGFKVEADLNETALQESLELLTRKHEIFRTSVIYKQVSIPRQVLLTNRKIEYKFVDLSIMKNIHAEYEILKKADVERGFDFEKDSLARVTVVQMAAQDYRILMCFHHIIVDGWCLSIINNNILDFYDRIMAGESKLEIEESIQKSSSYEEYIHLSNTRDIEKGLDYWRKLLNGYETQAAVSGSKENLTDIQTEFDEVKSVDIYFDSKQKNLLEEVSKKYGFTINTFLETAWGILLEKYNYTQDVVFGKVVSGRNIDFNDIDNKVGLFINTVPVRFRSNGKDSVLISLQMLQEQALITEMYDYCPLPDIQNQSVLGNQLFHTLIAFGNYYTHEDVNGKLKLFLDSFREQTNYPLTLAVYEEQNLRLELMYDTSIYTSSEADKIIGNFIKILGIIIEDVHIKNKDISLLDKPEEHRILMEFNQTETDYSEDKTIAELFEEIVEKTPNAIAVRAGNKELTYFKLNQKANQLAVLLREQKIKADCFVGIIADRTIETIVGILAIIKAGGAYMPIDPKYPGSRIEYMLHDSNCRVLLSGRAAINSDKFKKLSAQMEIIIDIEKENSDSQAVYNLEKVNSSSDLAYLIYTSGTTGEPKGVMIEQKSVNRLVKNTNYIDFSEVKILQTGSLTFDASTFEIWGALLNGGELHMVDSDILASASLLKETIYKYKINAMWLTSSLFNQMIAFDTEMFNGLKYLLIGGEKLSEKHVRFLRENNKDIHLLNGYGPTESTTFATTYEIKKMPNGNIPIGKPIANTEIYILNGNKSCGIGMKGEVCIGGPGLARGYLNQKELTKEKFITNPYNQKERLYCTGDMGYWLEDGNIEYLGRIDNQIKLRGFRIEIGEIENKLKELPFIQDAIVLLAESSGEKFLTGYIVAETEIVIEEAKNQLSVYLPDYMIPTYLLQIGEIPTTINGKLDKSKLPIPHSTINRRYVAPRNKIEQCITECFSEILGVDQVGINDNFFALGGHSLRATRLVNLIEQKLHIYLPLREIMTQPTVKDLAARVGYQNKSEKFEPITRQPRSDSYEMSSAQKRMYLVNKMEPDGINYNIPMIYNVEGTLDVKRLNDVFQNLCERYELFRTHFDFVDNKYLQKIRNHVNFMIEFEENESKNIEKDIHNFIRPFDLSKAPLMRAKVVKQSENASILMIDIHHIIFDGGSNHVFFEDIAKLYNYEVLPDLEIQYKDYSAWHNNKSFKNDEEFWLNEFNSEASVLELPTDYPRGKHQSFSGNTLRCKLVEKKRERIKQFALQTETTEYMVLFSAFNILLSKYTRQSEITIGTPVADRIHPDTQDMLGMFVNTLAMKTMLNPNMNYYEFLELVKEGCLKAFEHQDYPFDRLLDNMNTTRDLSRSPLFHILFVLQNNENFAQSMGTAKLSPHHFNYTVAKFDLSLLIDECDGGYNLNWEYCTDLFKKETIEQLGRHYTVLLDDILSSPDKKLNELNLLDAEDIMILKEFNRTTTDFSENKTIAELFEEVAEKTPNKIAVKTRNEEMTYAELNKKSNQLARNLRCMGVRANSIVGITAERTLETIVGILGITKAGGAYMPVDISYPVTRINYMIKDSNCKILLTGNKIQSINIENIINLSHESSYRHESDNLKKWNKPEDLAYIIYTSGTTGQPKGVMIEQRSVNRLVVNTNYIDFEEARILQTGSLTFDASTFEIWGSLLNSGQLYLVDSDVLVSAIKLKDALRKSKANIMWLTSSLFNQMISFDKEMFDSLNYLLIGGERLSEQHVRILKEHNKKIHLINGYGPTETTTFATTYEIKDVTNKSISIGGPIANTKIFILNHEKLCGVGMKGEICIGGVGVARGYLNHEELTAEKFIVNPYNQSERLYRTGDLGQWREDGTIEFLGRMDNQVKLRGFRIELGEIESKIKEQLYIEDAVVIILEANGEKYLASYIVGEKEINVRKVKKALGKSLPDYMIPAYIMQVDRFPTTTNGKLDKNKLPTPELKMVKEYVKPRNEIEEQIASFFSQILGVDRISIDDSFFEMGGHSLKAAKLGNMIERIFNVYIPLHTIFRKSTSEKLAVIVKEKMDTKIVGLSLDAAEEVII